MKQLLFATAICCCLLSACQTTTPSSPIVGNPPAEGFNIEASDEKAITIADQVMEAMGGRSAWEATRYISWNFFGSRSLFWDKTTGNVRVQNHRDSSTIYLNIYDPTAGTALGANGAAITDAEQKAAMLKRGKSIWINDSYWLVMPFKLKDSGVTLKYEGQDTTQSGKVAELLSLTFEYVGDTPQNKYIVYVDQTDQLVKQWDFYTNATDSLPRFSTPWEDYKKHGTILLSGNRGERGLTDIKVLDRLPEDMQDAPLFSEE